MAHQRRTRQTRTSAPVKKGARGATERSIPARYSSSNAPRKHRHSKRVIRGYSKISPSRTVNK